jgi:hypothetical protein
MPAGTRFRLFPQPWFPGSNQVLETVWLSPPPGAIGPGPSDDRMYVIDPVDRRRSYGIHFGPFGTPYLELPPWQGAIYRPPEPDPAGHFDHLEPGTAQFEAVHAYGAVRFVLDVWEGYFGGPIAWHFGRNYDRLEVVLHRELDNALAGYGFMEVGGLESQAGDYVPFSLNFDVLAHEVGHLIIYSQVGLPSIEVPSGEYFGFHEAAADVVAVISVLHFDSVVDDLLDTTSGNLYVLNRLNRIAELSDNDQIRLASNASKLSDFATGWTNEHDLSEPLTGAMFDILVDIFHESLLARRLITPEVEDLADELERRPEYEGLLQALFDDSYATNAEGFKEALLEARDLMGIYLTNAWTRLSPDSLNYDDVGGALLEVDRDLTAGRYHRLIRRNFDLRDIGRVRVGPRLAPPTAASHAFSARTVLPEVRQFLPRMSYCEHRAVAAQRAARRR